MTALRFTRAWACSLVFTIAASAAAQPAAAPAAAKADAPATEPSAQAVKEARERYERGLSLYSGGEYLLALVEFERAYQLAPNYRVLYNIGQVRIQLARYSKAREALESYLQQGGSEINAERRKAVEADLQMLAERTAQLRIVSNEAGVEISLDNVAIGTTPISEPLVVDAGEHSLEARKNGFYGKSTRVTLAGRDDMEVRLDVTVIPDSKAVVVEGPTTAPHRDRSLIYAGWAATGALAVGAGVAGYLGVTKANDLESMRTDYGVTQRELQDTKSSARTLFMIGDIAGAAAIVTGAVSLYFTLTSGGSSNEKAPPTKPKVGVVVAPNGVGLKGTF